MSGEASRVSVLIPSYNHAQYVAECVESIWRQPTPGVEIVVLDDGSTDGTYEVVKSLQERSPIPMRVSRQENQGTPRTLNRLIKEARGEFVALFASDDVFAPDRLSAQLALFDAHPGMQLVYGNGRYMVDGRLEGWVHEDSTRDLLRRTPQQIYEYLCTHGSPLFLQTTLIRRRFLDEIGGFDESQIADDWVLNIRMFRQLESRDQFGFVDEDLCHYRWHASNSHTNIQRHLARVMGVINVYTPPELRASLRAREYRLFAHKSYLSRRYGLTALYAARSLWERGRAALSRSPG